MHPAGSCVTLRVVCPGTAAPISRLANKTLFSTVLYMTGFDPVWTTNVFALVDSYVDIFLPKNRSFAKKKSPLRLFADNSLFLFNRKQRPAARREIEPTSTRIRSDRIRDERRRYGLNPIVASRRRPPRSTSRRRMGACSGFTESPAPPQQTTVAAVARRGLSPPKNRIS